MDTRRSGFQHRSLTVTGRLPPGQRPAIIAADGSAPRSRLACTTTLTAGTLARGTVSCSPTWTRSALNPVSTGDRETERYHCPSQGFQSGLPEKQRDAFIAAHGRDIRSGASSCTTVTPAAGALLTASSALIQPGNSGRWAE
jgi:hypothetical protein